MMNLLQASLVEGGGRCHISNGILSLTLCLYFLFCFKAEIQFCYDSVVPETRHERHCATPQTYFCHHRGKGVETFDLEIHKVNSMSLWLLSAFFPHFICQHPSASLKEKRKRKEKVPISLIVCLNLHAFHSLFPQLSV